ncbi:MAG: PilZ domain-containing protein [Nitrospiraceae bacterium]|nr:MAG: PilZ domain-containing protein [Nitrospiraceae bacterium]
MEKRRHKRIFENLDAEIINGNIRYQGIIMNFSEDGLYMITATSNKVVEFGNKSQVKLKCRLPSGEELTMKCEIKWFQTKSSPHGTSFSMGMEIINPPSKYKKFIDSTD